MNTPMSSRRSHNAKKVPHPLAPMTDVPSIMKNRVFVDVAHANSAPNERTLRWSGSTIDRNSNRALPSIPDSKGSTSKTLMEKYDIAIDPNKLEAIRGVHKRRDARNRHESLPRISKGGASASKNKRKSATKKKSPSKKSPSKKSRKSRG